jgi:hypothetical protein
MEGFFATGFLLMLAAMMFGTLLLWRYLRYRETIYLADRGLVRVQSGNGRELLRWGIVITFLGLATCLGLYPFGWMAAPGEFPLNFGPWMLLGLLPTAFGVALLVIYQLGRREPTPSHEAALLSSGPRPDSPPRPAESTESNETATRS